MSRIRRAGYLYDCSIPLCYMSFINLSLLIASLALDEFDMVKASSRFVGNPYARSISYLFRVVTAILSITTIFATFFSSRKVILILLTWDSYRLLFVTWAASGVQTSKEFFYFAFLVCWLVLCLLTEMSHLAPSKLGLVTPTSTIAILEDHERFNYPPRYQDIVPPPPYSSRESSSSSSAQPVQPASSTVFTITEGRSAEASFSFEIPPPSYESLGFDENPRF